MFGLGNIFNTQPASESRAVNKNQAEETAGLLVNAGLAPAAALAQLGTTLLGLTLSEAAKRLRQFGFNEVASERQVAWPIKLLKNFKDPLSILLLILGVVAYFTGDNRATVLILAMMVLSIILRFIQEIKADKAAQKLKNMVHTTVSVLRQGRIMDIPLRRVVKGDLVRLSAGDMVPADVRLLESRDLFVNQSALTGESMPVEKHAAALTELPANPLELNNICYLGTNVVTGTAEALVLATGSRTYFGILAKSIVGEREITSFEKGVNSFTWLMIRLVAILVPLVFVINGFSKGNWLEAFLFALAVAVGLTPELLPMIMTVNLSKGAIDMSSKKVIVKRLNAIQNFGAMDILCTDKTGTLTKGEVTLIKFIDGNGVSNEAILDYAYVNSFYQTGLRNLLDAAVLQYPQKKLAGLQTKYKKIDELPFDFIRRRMSVVVENQAGQHLLICKGAVEEVLAAAKHIILDGQVESIVKLSAGQRRKIVEELSADGFRLIAVAIKELPLAKQAYAISDENDLTLLGFLAFLDPAKESAAAAIKELERYGVKIKVLTGDNELVTRKICQDVNFKVERILRGQEIELMSEAELSKAADEASVFDKLEPHHKERVIKALQQRGHVVGFMGDGINDAPALKAADVGISVDTAVDIARESSDIILLEKSLEVLQDGVREGRKVFGNIIKYIKMAASSNFGNMFSYVGASIFLPFLPMLPLQVIANNLLYDFSQVTIPTDSVDEEYLVKPRQWDIRAMRRFILYIGPVSSIFDYLTYGLMLWVFNTWANPSLFQTGWFVESLMTQTFIIHIIRTNRIPFLQSHASWYLTLTTFLIVGFGAWLPFSPLAGVLGFRPLPLAYWFYLFGMLLLYLVITQIIKTWFVKKYET